MEIQGRAHIGVLTAEFFIPQAASLKDKRSVLKRMRECVRREFNLSLAEIAYQDKWQRSQWVFCLVGSNKGYIDGVIQKLIEFLRSGRHASLIDYYIEFL
jgi:uncharacterized protein YlxP (DUF503 family)